MELSEIEKLVENIFKFLKSLFYFKSFDADYILKKTEVRERITNTSIKIHRFRFVPLFTVHSTLHVHLFKTLLFTAWWYHKYNLCSPMFFSRPFMIVTIS